MAHLIQVIHKRHLSKEDLVKAYKREATLLASAKIFHFLAMVWYREPNLRAHLHAYLFKSQISQMKSSTSSLPSGSRHRVWRLFCKLLCNVIKPPHLCGCICISRALNCLGQRVVELPGHAGFEGCPDALCWATPGPNGSGALKCVAKWEKRMAKVKAVKHPNLNFEPTERILSLSACSTMKPHFGKNVKGVFLWPALFWSSCMVPLNHHLT